MVKQRYLYILLGVAIAVQIIFGVVIYCFFEDWAKSGSFGDTFGAVNSLFTSLAFGALIYTIILQSNELKIQREELVLTREQITEAAKSQKEQAKYTLLSAKISAAISKQEIYASHYVNEKQFPEHEQFNFGQIRRHLGELMQETDRLIEEASKKID
ncbi:hypothetical protein [uncultured Cedecea sp.]|uniref:hypothetical protein n=1 Tax=uncultured Cedecea sp. TaxID=988762 RepID=UPI002626F962|nr:hypothetical protein [uncultured Cedecea sp.]